MSLESALDEERREVMDILEGRTGSARSASGANSTAFGQNGRTASPAAPVRSMLDVEGPAISSRTSGAGRRADATSPPPNRSSRPPSVRSVRSLLDPDVTGPPPTLYTHSATTSPIQPHPPSGGLHRAQSDASAHPPDGRRRVPSDRDRGINPNSDYQFEMLPSIASHALPKRVTQGGKKSSILPSAMASIMQGQELGPLPRGRDRGRHNSTAGIIGAKSKSPSSRLGNRPQSPGGSILNTNSFNLMPTPGKFVTDGGKVIDLNNAYRRLSDAALLKSGGNLSNLPVRQSSERRVRADSGEALSPTGGIRLQKDYYNEDDDDAAIESSDEDKEASSGDEPWGSENLRGRRRSRKKRDPGSSEADWEDSDNDGSLKGDAGGTLGMGRTQHPRKVKSLLAAAEEEHQGLSVSSQYKVRSLLEPTVTVTGPGGERLAAKKPGVHPSTSYDHTASGLSSPMTSDTEAELTDIRRAQRMSVNISPIDNSIEHRLIRTVIRGEFSKMQQEAEEGSRRLRTYLVATDLSDEAAYALEWTIGIVLRDGDTLIAVYAIDEESGNGKGGDGESIHGVGIGEGAKAMQDTAAAIGSLTAAATQNAYSKPAPSPLAAGSLLPGTDSKGGSVDSRNMSKAETERYRAIEDISQRCIRLVRKTKLQVRIAVEVIHCKSAKRLITEAIDGLEPTMVILGSRGRSALKGVLLGSFSNYLVTKSSVPVMVARRRLKKHAKDRKINPRLSNNLTNPSRLETAKID